MSATRPDPTSRVAASTVIVASTGPRARDEGQAERCAEQERRPAAPGPPTPEPGERPLQDMTDSGDEKAQADHEHRPETHRAQQVRRQPQCREQAGADQGEHRE